MSDADYQRLSELVIAGEMEGARALTEQLLAQGRAGREILDGGLLPGMEVVGARMKAGECFIPEVLLSARTMQGCLDLIKPHLAAGDSGSRRHHPPGHRAGRRARHRQEPGRHDARGGRLYRAQPGRPDLPRRLRRRRPRALPADPRHERPSRPPPSPRWPTPSGCSPTRACAAASRSWSAAPR